MPLGVFGACGFNGSNAFAVRPADFAVGPSNDPVSEFIRERHVKCWAMSLPLGVFGACGFNGSNNFAVRPTDFAVGPSSGSASVLLGRGT